MSKSRIDLQKDRLPPVSKRYILRLVIYIVIIAILVALIYSLRNVKDKNEKQLNDVDNIEGVTLEEPS